MIKKEKRISFFSVKKKKGKIADKYKAEYMCFFIIWLNVIQLSIELIQLWL